MRVDLFDYDLPPALIAARPMEQREAARLLVVEGDRFHDRHIRDLPDLLRPSDLLVVNDTRVIPARLFGRRGDARIQITLHQKLGPALWSAFVRPAKRLKAGDLVGFADGFAAEVVERRAEGEILLRFALDGAAFWRALENFGVMPLPPYIARQRPEDARDREDYQTVFAKHEGAIAAPTAGFHFTPALLERLAEQGISPVAVTLHVGAGTFLPVKAEDTEDHAMHAEWGEVGAAAAAAINRTRAAGGRIVAIGTTSLRLLESAAAEDGSIRPFAAETRLFITPGYRFKAVDVLLTNFHLPRSTLLMLVSAFAGRETILAAYAHAIEAGYRFYSYGDACLLHRAAAVEAA
jgi:S-adenosylmethionine:tRNA ribosyltransferase-isomerase